MFFHTAETLNDGVILISRLILETLLSPRCHLLLLCCKTLLRLRDHQLHSFFSFKTLEEENLHAAKKGSIRQSKRNITLKTNCLFLS